MDFTRTHHNQPPAIAAAAPPAATHMTAEEALRQAEAEGLTLLRSESNASGFQCVSMSSLSKAKPYHAQVRRGGRHVHLGSAASAEEAALAFARSPEGRAAAAAAAAPPPAPPMTAEEARRQAEEEGLTLLRSESNATGFQGVTSSGSCTAKPYMVKVRRGGAHVGIGTFATAEEAALAFARSPEGRVAAAAAAAPPEPHMTAEEARRQAEAEDLTLLRSESSVTGFLGVTSSSGKAKPYKVQVRRGGKQVSLGTFATAEEAALAFARSPEGRAAAAAPPPPPQPHMTAEEARWQAEAEGLTLLRSESNATGFLGVTRSGRSSKAMPYMAKVRRGGGVVVGLGTFATAEEAALAFARSPEGRAATAAAATPPPEPHMTAEEARRLAEEEGLTLLRSESSVSGFLGVTSSGSGTAKPYMAKVRRGGAVVGLGTFATAEEAIARLPESRAAAAAAAAPPAAPHMTPEEARRQAEAEGLTLLRSESNAFGFKGVSSNGGKARPYTASVWRGGKRVHLGTFATAEEAALAFARSPEGRAATAAAAAPAAEPHMTPEEARRQAEAEGLPLLRSESTATGFKGVSLNGNGRTKPYTASVTRGGRSVSLGTFATAEEAALAFARSPEGRAAAAAAAAPPAEPHMTPEEARRQAEAEGLPLLRSERNATGFKGVSMNGNCRTRPYMAQVWRGGKPVHLGTFATAEEAALAFARSPEGRAATAAAAVPPEPHMTAEEARRQAEEEGLTLLRSETSTTGFQGVSTNGGSTARPDKAEVWRGGRPVYLGTFATAGEAALAVARSPEGREAAAAATAPPPPPEPHMTAEEARRLAEEEGLMLLRSESSTTGFQGVSFSGNQAKPYQANVQRGGTTVTLGFHTAEEAALAVARQVLLEAMALIGRDKTGARLAEDNAARGDMKRRRLGSD